MNPLMRFAAVPLVCVAWLLAAGWLTAAQSFRFPSGLTLDPQGNIILADRQAHRVFRIDPGTGATTTIAGTGAPGYSGDGGPASSAVLRNPEWVEFDRAGNLILADRGNHVLRRIDARSGAISTIVGTGTYEAAGDGGPAQKASLTNPFGFTQDRDGNIFIFDTEIHSIRRVDVKTMTIATVIGSLKQGFSGDGGPATKATLYRPHNGVFDPSGRLVFGDSFNQRIRRYDPTSGVIETIAGIGEQGAAPDGTPASKAQFTFFGGMAYHEGWGPHLHEPGPSDPEAGGEDERDPRDRRDGAGRVRGGRRARGCRAVQYALRDRDYARR